MLSFRPLPGDLARASTTPAFSFVVPNLCCDGHDAPCVTGGFDRSRLRLLRPGQPLSASCSSLVISSVVASTVRFTTLAAFVSALSIAFSMVGSPTAMSPAWLAVSCSAASWSS